MRTLPLIALAVLLSGCSTHTYQPVPLCALVPPQDPARSVEASPDERLVMMTNSYIGQVRAVSNCNLNIKLINAANGAK